MSCRPRPPLPPLPAALLFLVLSASPAVAQSGKAKAKDRPSVQVSAQITFSSAERTRIVEFFAGHPQPEPVGLPPGIRKNLARGKPLPPGIAKKVLPAELEGALPTRDGYQRVVVGLDVLLVEVATGVIHDVLMDVIR